MTAKVIELSNDCPVCDASKPHERAPARAYHVFPCFRNGPDGIPCALRSTINLERQKPDTKNCRGKTDPSLHSGCSTSMDDTLIAKWQNQSNVDTGLPSDCSATYYLCGGSCILISRRNIPPIISSCACRIIGPPSTWGISRQSARQAISITFPEADEFNGSHCHREFL